MSCFKFVQNVTLGYNKHVQNTIHKLWQTLQKFENTGWTKYLLSLNKGICKCFSTLFNLHLI